MSSKKRKRILATCSICGNQIPEGQEIAVSDRGSRPTGAVVCDQCVDGMTRILRAETEDLDLARAGLAALVGAVLSCLLWYGAAQNLRSGVPFMAVPVGVAVARAAMWGAGGKRGRPLQVLSGVITALALVLDTFLILRHFAQQALVEGGEAALPLWMPITSVLTMFRAWVESDPSILLFGAFALWEAYHIPAARHLKLPETEDAQPAPSESKE